MVFKSCGFRGFRCGDDFARDLCMTVGFHGFLAFFFLEGTNITGVPRKCFTIVFCSVRRSLSASIRSIASRVYPAWDNAFVLISAKAIHISTGSGCTCCEIALCILSKECNWFYGTLTERFESNAVAPHIMGRCQPLNSKATYNVVNVHHNSSLRTSVSPSMFLNN